MARRQSQLSRQFNRRRTARWQRMLAAAALCLGLVNDSANDSAIAAEAVSPQQVALLFKQYCFDCHSGPEAEAGIDLDKLAAAGSLADDGSLARGFKQWQKVAAALEAKKMPPTDAEQPADDARREVAAFLRRALDRLIARAADDPGPLVMRRLTSAEYAYTIHDLTGLDLNLEDEFVDGAVGGEGFTNVGSAQFLHDATLVRYLLAARRVADHAVVGAGPLVFFRDPGKTGRELFAIHRLNDLSQMNFGFLDGVHGALHLDLTHNGRDPELEAMYLKTNQFHVRQFAYLIDRLKAIDEGGRSLLDNSLLLFCSNLFDGDRHQADEMPMLLAGRGGGTLQTGRVLDYLRGGDEQRRACSLYLSLMDRLGVELRQFGDAEQRLAGL